MTRRPQQTAQLVVWSTMARSTAGAAQSHSPNPPPRANTTNTAEYGKLSVHYAVFDIALCGNALRDAMLRR
jgi:hypothetical protein